MTLRRCGCSSTRGASPRRARSQQAVEVLHAGGVAAYPTDSIYALGCAIEARDAIERIYRAKQMNKNQRLALICPDLSTASRVRRCSRRPRSASRSGSFPGPYTLVVPATRAVPQHADRRQAPHGRHPRHEPPDRAGARAGARPAAADDERDRRRRRTSRVATPTRSSRRSATFVDVVIDAAQTPAEPSTVLEVDGDQITLIRQGQGRLDGILE